jgi:hypothetical protein
MLAHNERKEGKLERMPFPLNEAKTVLPNVRILGSIGNKSHLGKSRSETVVVRRVHSGISNLLRAPFESVLANDYRPPLSGPYVLWDKKSSESKYTGPNVQHDLVAGELWLVIDQACAGVHGQRGRRESANDFVPYVLAVKAGGCCPALGRRGISS